MMLPRKIKRLILSKKM